MHLSNSKESASASVGATLGELVQAPAQEQPRSLRERQERNEGIAALRQQQDEAVDIISSFLTASQGGNIMECEVAGVGSDGDDVFWQCVKGPVTVRIPFEETCDELPAPLLDPACPNLVMRKKQFLSKSLGLSVYFVVTSFLPDPHHAGQAIAVGSRVQALRKIRRNYFGANANKRINKGDIVTAQILNIGAHAGWLTFCGVDVRFSPSFSHRYLPDLAAIYHVGDKIKVQVTKIEEDPQTGKLSIEVSRRPIELKESESRRTIAGVGNYYAATVISKKAKLDRNPPVVITSLWIEGVDIPAYSKKQNPLVSCNQGDKVYVKILGYTRDGYAHCDITGKAGRGI